MLLFEKREDEATRELNLILISLSKHGLKHCINWIVLLQFLVGMVFKDNHIKSLEKWWNKIQLLKCKAVLNLKKHVKEVNGHSDEKCNEANCQIGRFWGAYALCGVICPTYILLYGRDQACEVGQ